MSIITPNMKDVIERKEYFRWRREGKQARVKQRYFEKKKRGHEWLTTEHWFQYMHGDHKIGKPVKMFGVEARDRNRKLEDKFFKDKDPKSRLGHWYWLGKQCEDFIGEGMRHRGETIGVKADD